MANKMLLLAVNNNKQKDCGVMTIMKFVTRLALRYLTLGCLAVGGLLTGCNHGDQSSGTNDKANTQAAHQNNQASGDNNSTTNHNHRFDIYKKIELNSDLTQLTTNQKKMISLLIDAAQIMDDLYWKQTYGDRGKLLSSLKDPKVRHFAEINYGPSDRLAGDKPFIQGHPNKPLGANFYPADMRKEEFNSANIHDKKGLYSLIKRQTNGQLYSVPFHIEYQRELTQAAALLEQAARFAENNEFKNYLKLRAKALLTDDFQPSDLAWMDMKTNRIELVIGPIETYEDQLFGYRAAYEAYILIKDTDWSKKLAKYASLLPTLQKSLPVDEKYKQEKPGSNADLNAYDAIYYAGHGNTGSKTIAINLPNDEAVQLAKGTRRLQLKNTMKAKFDHILVPIANKLIEIEQRHFITFDAFFANTMFHEIAHGLGIKNTINNRGPVRSSLKETASALEEGKADVLGLYMIAKLYESGDITQGQLMDNYVTFLAGIFRSVRFGASSAHGKANMVRFNFFKERGAFSRNPRSGLYRVDFDAMTAAIDALSKHILILQGNGDYAGAVKLLAEKGVVGKQLKKDLALLEKAAIPVDIIFSQGKAVLGL